MKKILLCFVLITMLLSVGLVSATDANQEGFVCPKTGGVMKINFSMPADQIGIPAYALHYNHTFYEPSLEPLMHATDEVGVYVPALATSWEYAEDKSYLDFTLREGVIFHDGSEFNAEVAKWNFEIYMDAGSPAYRAVDSVEVIGDYAIRLHLNSWDATLINDISRGSAMISQEAYEANGHDWALYNPVGTGAFEMVEFEREQLLRYEAFDGYWQEGLPCLDGIEYHQVPDPMTQMAMLQVGDLQALSGIPPFIVAQALELNDDLDVQMAVGLHIVIVMNTTDSDSVWSDIRMREALEYGVDKELIVDATGFGLNHSVNEIIHSLHSAGGTPDTTPRAYDPDMSRALMAEAGYGDGISVKLTYASTMPEDAMVILQAQLAQVGINLELDPVDAIALNQMSFEPADGSDLRIQELRGGGEPLGSAKETLSAESLYFPGVVRPDGFQELLDEALQTEDVATRLDLLSQAETLAYNDAIIIPLWNSPLPAVYKNTIMDAQFITGGNPISILTYTWLDE
jgi:peptide/nickel transport system substrate-binding protein